MSTIQEDIRKSANPIKAKLLSRYFKTGKGEYGEGDIFLGITVPELRTIAKKYISLPLKDVEKLLTSKIHEERFISLEILAMKFESADEKEKKEIFDFYLKNRKCINNWDLVDNSAHEILGRYLLDKDKSVLYKLAESSSLWDKRIAIITTYRFIANNNFSETLKISEMLLKDKHDLIHKAVGWMLRELGKRDKNVEQNFLKKHYKIMPRTMLRYAIEKFPQHERKAYLKGEI